MKDKIIILILIIVGVCGCSEGGTGGTGFDAEGEFTESKTSIGIAKVLSANAIEVNNVQYVADESDVVVDNRVVSLADLSDGMIVTVSGKVNSEGTKGEAESIYSSNKIAGPITQIISDESFKILNSIIQLNSETNFGSNLAVSNLSPGMSLMIHGFVDQDDVLHATYVDQTESYIFTQQISGYVSDIDSSLYTFTLDGLTVDYATVSVGVVIADGDFVVVTGTYDASTNRLSATEVQSQDFAFTSSQTFDIQGFIAEFKGDYQFTVNGITVSLDELSNIENALNGNVEVGMFVNMTCVPGQNGLTVTNLVVESFSNTQSKVNSQSENNQFGQQQGQQNTNGVGGSNLGTNTQVNSQGSVQQNNGQ